MLKYNNNHIFTGYLKQLLSSFSLPACRIYTRDFSKHLEMFGKEDPRVLTSFDSVQEDSVEGQNQEVHAAVRINYLKNEELYNYFQQPTIKKTIKNSQITLKDAFWKRSAELYYDKDKFIPGLTRHLNSPGINYDTKTHEYLGDFLRFIRDYYNVNLMSLYNCFTDKIYSNIYFPFVLNPSAPSDSQVKVIINANEPAYRLYALPVKLFANYTIAVDCAQGIELFCGLYNTNLDMSNKAEDLARRTYQKVHATLFKQPFLYEKLNSDNWSDKTDFVFNDEGEKVAFRTDGFTRWDLAAREKDLKLFIKVPVSCKSSITILEGDFRNFNNIKYEPTNGSWKYKNNHCTLNFNLSDRIDLNNYNFKPISQVQLLAFNTGESYPFADRLIEYLAGSAITPLDEIPDNIKRVQRVMEKNNHYFKISGLWENKIQNILYDYIMNSGLSSGGKGTGKSVEGGYHRTLGHTSKSTLFDILGYVDKDVEKWYASWRNVEGKAIIGTSLQSVDIYDGLYDI